MNHFRRGGCGGGGGACEKNAQTPRWRRPINLAAANTKRGATRRNEPATTNVLIRISNSSARIWISHAQRRPPIGARRRRESVDRQFSCGVNVGKCWRRAHAHTLGLQLGALLAAAAALFARVFALLSRRPQPLQRGAFVGRLAPIQSAPPPYLFAGEPTVVVVVLARPTPNVCLRSQATRCAATRRPAHVNLRRRAPR